MLVCKPPAPPVAEAVRDKIVIFLAGSIEMGTAENWQDKVVEKFKALPNSDDFLFLNPRRDDWDPSWVQSIYNKQFHTQVNWELDGIMKLADFVLFHFDPSTKSPITLMELGILAGMDINGPTPVVAVSCPDGFWRKGNVEVICHRFLFPIFQSLDDLIESIILELSDQAQMQ